jgi:hypothetical protein
MCQKLQDYEQVFQFVSGIRLRKNGFCLALCVKSFDLGHTPCYIAHAGRDGRVV